MYEKSDFESDTCLRIVRMLTKYFTSISPPHLVIIDDMGSPSIKPLGKPVCYQLSQWQNMIRTFFGVLVTVMLKGPILLACQKNCSKKIKCTIRHNLIILTIQLTQKSSDIRALFYIEFILLYNIICNYCVCVTI